MRKLKNLKIYKGVLVLGTSSIILMTSCGETREVEYKSEPKIEEETDFDEKIDLDHIEPDNNQTDEYVITIIDESSNDETNESNAILEEQNTTDLNSENNAQTNDEIIVTYFNDLKNDLNNTSSLDEFKEKAIDLFITTTDFIFYDTEIYGIRYNDLKDETKKTILNDFAEIDSIISIKYPTYKEDIKTKYNKAADWTVDKYNGIINNIKENLNDETLDSIDNLHDNLKDTGNSLKDTTSNIYEEEKVKVKSWYENYKNNH